MLLICQLYLYPTVGVYKAELRPLPRTTHFFIVVILLCKMLQSWIVLHRFVLDYEGMLRANNK